MDLNSETDKNRDNFQEYLLEQYKVYVEMMDKVTERRGQLNKFYITLLSSLLALPSFLLNKDNALFSGDTTIVLLGIAFLGVCLCYVWFVNINSYKQLNSLKFKVIDEMESLLPFACYRREWEILNVDVKNKYRRLSKIEKFVPIILAIPYIVLLFYSISILF